ncbi:MAG TPA: alpha/beta hydrolase [Caulobacteraceae bacterium]|jgi:acetyl esterase/lipase|nr:alpha/beta hydrolase [Caulobacteraceae bacterium]
MKSLQVLALAASLLLVSVVAGSTSSAKAVPWQPPAGHMQFAIWPGGAPDLQPVPGLETASDGEVTNVTRPTLTVYAPQGKNTGAMVIVIPGGGFQMLFMDLEGTELCDWLTAKGVACAVLKYRVPGIPYVWQCKCRPHNHDLSMPSLQDVQRTMRLARAHAAEWHVDPHKIGVMGFSAGGFLVAEISTHFDDHLYGPVDAADRESARPDFAMAIYPGHLAMADNAVVLNPVIADHITKQTPPTFLLQNEDDDVDQVEDALSYYMGLKKAGVPVELHSYAQGGHAFGLREKKLPVRGWPGLVETWLVTIGMVSP